MKTWAVPSDVRERDDVSLAPFLARLELLTQQAVFLNGIEVPQQIRPRFLLGHAAVRAWWRRRATVE